MRAAARLIVEAAWAGDACALVILKTPLETSGLSEGASNRQGSVAESKQECATRVDIVINGLEDMTQGADKWEGWMQLWRALMQRWMR